eukprot:scaffold161396_cov30-Tisochrysis_lutea.AAC.11
MFSPVSRSLPPAVAGASWEFTSAALSTLGGHRYKTLQCVALRRERGALGNGQVSVGASIGGRLV